MNTEIKNAVIKNAVIKSASITIEDHGFLTARLMLDYGNAGQGFGGFPLACGPENNCWCKDLNYTGVFIYRVLQIAEVSSWADLPRKVIRTRSENGLIRAIGHVVKEDWFCPKEIFEEMEAREKAK